VNRRVGREKPVSETELKEPKIGLSEDGVCCGGSKPWTLGGRALEKGSSGQARGVKLWRKGNQKQHPRTAVFYQLFTGIEILVVIF
jgi:hypothetical protein